MAPKVLRVAPRECPEEYVLEATRILREGGLVALPTETVYGVAGLLDGGQGERRLRELKGRDDDHKPFTVALGHPEDAAAHAPAMPWCARRLAARYWPGSLTLVVADHQGESLGLRVPARLFTRTVISQASTPGCPLALSSANPAGDTPAVTAEEVAAALGDRVDLIVDGGPAELGEASTVVRAIEPHLEILRAGTLSRAEVEAQGCYVVLFLCSGNTCRSPMAEALAHQLTAEHLGLPPNEYSRSGLLFISAGTGTLPGMPASEHALAAMAETGGDLQDHRSNLLHPGLLQAVHLVLGMTGTHLDRARSLPGGDRPPAIEPLLPDGGEVPDPFGGSLDDYRRARDRIREALVTRIPELLPRPWRREA